MTDLETSQKIQLAVALGNWKEGEDSKYWTRYSIFLTLNSGLLAASFIGGSSILNLDLNNKVIPLGGVIVGLFGCLLTYFWINLLKVSKSYIARWVADIDTLLRSNPEIEQYVKGYSDNSSRLQSPSKYKATEWSRGVLWIYFFIWVLILIFSSTKFIIWLY